MLTLAGPFVFAAEVKKSRFSAHAARADDRAAALAFLERVADPDANHNCWAFRAGQDYRFSDDGEPGGTAGQPILRAITGQGLDHVVVVVSRVFGGIKLGAGGLVRAYGGTAAECLRLAPRLEVRPRTVVRLEVPFESVGVVYPLLESAGALRVGEEYTATGLMLELSIEAAALEQFVVASRDATRGKAKIVPVEPAQTARH